jgi:hypothetical protein
MDERAIFGGLLAAAVATMLALRLYRGRRLAPVERGLTPLLSTFCSVGIANLVVRPAQSSFPSVRLAIYPKFLVFGFFSPIVIPLSDLTSVSVGNRILWGRQILIKTANGTDYWMIVKDPEAVARLLQKGGQSTDKQSNWICSKCRETNPLSFDLCWNCQTSRRNDSL